ncbi:tyrosine-type recombinase/integrase [Streptosporangium sandarakinum]|uniref:tyrosine-type recombinase/integrase n=1 Tax=Streptosporangium sandarakinum TaxID=1260955 RepID=UPI0033A6BE11
MVGLPEHLDPADDSLPVWTERYLELAVRGVRSAEVTARISRHLQRFAAWITDGLGHDRLSAVTPREVSAWRDHLAAAGNIGRDGTPAPMAPTTVNNHLAHVSALFTWITAHAPAGLLRHGDPTKKVAPLPLPLPAPQPRALAAAQIRTVKNIVDRIETFHELKGRRHRGAVARAHAHARPLRDRAIIYLLFGTGLRRAELVGLDLDQLEPAEVDRLRQAKKARLTGVRGKGRTSRTIFVGRDARHTFAFQLSQASGHDRAELERRLGHANDRYLRLYTNPPDDIAAGYIEDL